MLDCIVVQRCLFFYVLQGCKITSYKLKYRGKTNGASQNMPCLFSYKAPGITLVIYHKKYVFSVITHFASCIYLLLCSTLVSDCGIFSLHHFPSHHPVDFLGLT